MEEKEEVGKVEEVEERQRRLKASLFQASRLLLFVLLQFPFLQISEGMEGSSELVDEVAKVLSRRLALAWRL